ncbi:hypothetical protein MYX82_03025 [Acidobacteria bacterium AH-259-D05]|nr:hypothetical protein [Acidobacteria bacterium AH-259-D05]
MIHDPERVETIRKRVAAEKQLITSLEAKTKDDGIRQYLAMASSSIDDVESFFLGSLTKEQRTAQEEARWLDAAELVLRLSTQHRERVQNVFATYGPGAMTIE